MILSLSPFREEEIRGRDKLSLLGRPRAAGSLSGIYLSRAFLELAEGYPYFYDS